MRQPFNCLLKIPRALYLFNTMLVKVVTNAEGFTFGVTPKGEKILFSNQTMVPGTMSCLEVVQTLNKVFLEVMVITAKSGQTIGTEVQKAYDTAPTGIVFVETKPGLDYTKIISEVKVTQEGLTFTSEGGEKVFDYRLGGRTPASLFYMNLFMAKGDKIPPYSLNKFEFYKKMTVKEKVKLFERVTSAFQELSKQTNSLFPVTKEGVEKMKAEVAGVEATVTKTPEKAVPPPPSYKANIVEEDPFEQAFEMPEAAQVESSSTTLKKPAWYTGSNNQWKKLNKADKEKILNQGPVTAVK